MAERSKPKTEINFSPTQKTPHPLQYNPIPIQSMTKANNNKVPNPNYVIEVLFPNNTERIHKKYVLDREDIKHRIARNILRVNSYGICRWNVKDEDFQVAFF